MRKVARGSSLKLCIRPAKKEDMPAILELEKICFKEETFHKRQIKYLLLKARSTVLVASLEGNIVGSIIILLRKHISNARIYSLNVHPSYRRLGIGSSLMDHSEDILVNMGYRNFTLEAGVNNIAAQNLYVSKGFSLERRMEKYYKNGDEAIRFIKKL
ncbi:MAG: GNAT family N-acetyltransferase [Euryarchaeota archaeon]|nr:GNAT family N-acetyltransferase [Euryarchaeota archaeon]